MAQSYIPAGTDVICTEMTGGKPAQLGLTRKSKVLYGKERRPILNTCDKKLSCSLQCRIKQTFFSGLAGLLVGLALGALAVALVVATAGAGTVIVGAALTAALALDVAGGAALGASAAYRYLANECDASLEGQWSLYHKVYIEGHNALLERSLLTCSKGGIVSLVMDHQKAVELAKLISTANDKIADTNIWSKFKQGVVGNVSNALLAGFDGQAGGSVVGLVIGSGLSVYDYMKGGNGSFRDDNTVRQNKYALTALKSNDEQALIGTEHNVMTDDDWANTGIGTAASAGYSGAETVMTITIRNQELGKEAMNFSERAFQSMLNGSMIDAGHALWARDIALSSQKGLEDVPKEFWKNVWKGETKAFKWNISNKWFTLGSIGIGILSSIISNHIEGDDNAKENELYKNMMREITAARKEKKSGISVVSESL